MPIPQSQVLSVEDICTRLGYNTKLKPKRQYDLTLFTKAWRQSYVNSDGIPGSDIIDWNTDKGNADIKEMSEGFYQYWGARLWPSGNGGLERGRDEEQLLGLLHQLFWRQNLSAKNNGINKERQDTLQRKAQSLSPAHDHSHARVTRLSLLSEGHRRPRIGEGTYAESSTEDEEEDNQGLPNPIFTRRFILNLAQYREFRAAFQITNSTPAVDMAGKPAPASVPQSTTTPEHKSPTKATQVVTDPPHFVKDRSDTDSESMLHRRVMTRQRNVSGAVRRHREDNELFESSRAGAETVTGAVEAIDNASFSRHLSPTSWNIFASESPIGPTIKESSIGKNGNDAPPDGDLNRTRLSTRKRTLSQLSAEVPLPNNEKVSHPGNRAVNRCRRCQQWRKKCDVDKPCKRCRAAGQNCIMPESAGLKPPPIPDQSSSSARDGLRKTPRDASGIGSQKMLKRSTIQPLGKQQNTVPADRNVPTDHQDYPETAPNIPSGTQTNHSTDHGIPQTVNPTSAPPATKASLPNPTPKPKYYILASDSTSSFEERWTGPSLSEMTLETLFAQAAAHTSGREVLKIKFTLSSSQSGFIGRKNTVDRGEAGSLEEVRERFRVGCREGLKKGITQFGILLEPELGAQAEVEVEDFADVDVI